MGRGFGRAKEQEPESYEIERRPVTRYQPDHREGLTRAQAAERMAAGWSNIPVDPPAQTVKEIIHENVFTYFNLVFTVLAVLLCLVGSFRNLTFMPVIIINTLIGIVQEIRAKHVLEKLNMLNAPHALVVREGQVTSVDSEDLVLDDIVIFKAGNQICADAQVVFGEVRVNESLLTGESDEIVKKPGDHLMSGSFVVAGECRARLEQVGADSYISKLTLEAKAIQKGEKSEMIRSLDKLVKFVGIALIPIGSVLFAQSFFFNDETFRDSVTSMVAAVIGMIPEGLYLLASVALAVSSIRLAQKKVLLHDMKSIETLARVNVLCVDKTGTITENTMSVKKLVPTEHYDGETMPELARMVGDLVRPMSSDNATMEAMKEFFKEGTGKAPQKVIPFTSVTKYSGVTFEDQTYVLGAPEFVLREDYPSYESQILNYARRGYRVLVFGTCGEITEGQKLSEKVTPLAYILLANPVRKEAPETFAYFAEQGVEVKVISGDNPMTVSEVAKEAGIANADEYVDATTLRTEEDVWNAGGQIHRIWPGDAGPEAPVCPGPEGAGENGGHDRRRRQRCAGLKGRGLQRGYGFWKRRGGTGFPGGAPGVQFRLHAFGGIGRKKGGQQHSAFGQPVPGEEHFLLPAVPVLSGVYDHLSAGAFPGVADQYVHHWRAGLLPGAPAQQRGDPGTFPDQRIF